jgi:hypothetical protein
MNHLTSQQIEGYHSGTLELAEEYLAIDAHMAGCATCREQLGARSRALPEGLGRLMAEDAHPEGELLVRYAQENSDVPAIVAQHVAVCARCRQDVATLQTFRQTVTPEIWAEARAATEAPAVRPSFGEWLHAAVAGRAFRVWAPAMAFCLLLLLVFVWRNQQVVAIQDGSGRWALTRGGKLTGPIPLPADLESTLRKALQNRSLETPGALAALASPADAHYRPAGTIVRSDLPKLQWEPVPNGVSYQCTLTSPDDPKFKRGAPKPMKSAFWVLKKPLPRGKVYTWQVVVTLRNGKKVALTGSPYFKVLEIAKEQVLEQAAKTYAGSHLALGLLYAQNGVLDEAEPEFAALQRANPDSETIKTFLNQLRASHRSLR